MVDKNVKKENIKKLMFLNGTTGSYDQTIKEMISSIKVLVPDVDKLDLDDISMDVLDRMILIYDENLTDEEILQLIDFYNSDFGKMYTTKMEIIMKEGVKVGQQIGEILSKKLQKYHSAGGETGISE